MVWPMLRPGIVLRRRSATTWQLDAVGNLLIADRPGLRGTLGLIDGSRSPQRLAHEASALGLHEPITNILDELGAIGALVEVDSPRRVTVYAEPITRAFVDLLSASGVLPGRRVRHRQEYDESPGVVITVHASEPERDPLRVFVAHHEVHLPIVFDVRHIAIGPWIEGGRTPCLHCHDEHRATWDPAWSVLATQFGSAGPRWLGGSPSTHIAAALEVSRWLETPPRPGIRVTIGPEGRREFAFGFNPRCGCRLVE